MTTTSGAPVSGQQRLQDQALTALEDLLAHHWRQGPGGRWARRDLTVAQMHLLMVLREHGPATVGQLASLSRSVHPR